jgi:hypothetical protein
LFQHVVNAGGDDVFVLPSPLGRPHTGFLNGCHGFVYDLAPWDRSAVELVRLIRRENPILPIFLYPPPVPGATELVLECGSIIGVSAQSQSHVANAVSALRRGVYDLLDSVAELVFVGLIQEVVHRAPHEVLEFTRVTLRVLQTEQRVASLSVTRIALRLRVPTRTLRRSWQRTSLPSPKEMLDWLVLLFVNFEAERRGVPVSKIATRLGLDRQHLYRIRRRLLFDVVRSRPTTHTRSFEYVLLAFMERCGLERREANETQNRLFA